MTEPLIRVRGVSRAFPAGDEMVRVLKDVDLDIEAGEMMAIIGASGSGKSTLMNILGCLDRPTDGSYWIEGRETSKMSVDELAALRRERFGFIFQRYHLLGDLSAASNVEVPAIYAGRSRSDRHKRAISLLTRLGLAERTGNIPGKLSGGQQQRVSIARALMNGGEIILADEPTGALDTHSGAEVMKILRELHAEGHTIILVTHDKKIAEHADRVVEISDGVIISDERNISKSVATARPIREHAPGAGWRGAIDRMTEAFRMAGAAIWAHKMRSLLTMLGIIIGIASVAAISALGAGSQQQILSSISSLGTNTIEVRAGKGFGDLEAGKIRTLVPADAEALVNQPYVDSVTPTVTTSVTVKRAAVAVNASVTGVGADFFRVRGLELAHGQLFDAQDVIAYSQNVVIDANAARDLFPDRVNPVGQVILLGTMPARVVGVTKRENSFGPAVDTLTVYAPYTTVMGRMLGRPNVDGITVRIRDDVDPGNVEAAVSRLIERRHGAKDFFLTNSATIRETIETTTQTLTLLISSVAVISLIVGGIGVMNIMLVSVTERTKEIGVRVAVGARRSDILSQFLIEAVMVCLVGGFMGVMLALGISALFNLLSPDFKMIFSSGSIMVAFACSTLIGIVFGFLPARNAAKLDPIEALARD
ncbi:Macrolide export ATP-binding/permease protein MacB [Rhizobium rhizogenes]|uniref:Pyoverdine export ATP-binding/permease protein PvdT n=1 Tax=Rhizobium rhizogenes TaxID=359 RepID=A0AAN2A5U8_RHIRH|nr:MULTISPECIES: MacB family efflux pump subunit [Rhizobium/Agrobacterium group]AQS64595.1 MacB family efflux pump subunit [Rhizobium rhizogenes]MCZ7445776.1 MacB family efflux pump subunit [Rhizobium rhizogenes]NSZ81660.1 MacB family efflux pump subunit [Agrobacterium tumefaciens]OAM63091.1 macrolide ABC transporter permease/ATP-binding protein MacB [Rhizobium rhizogenes]CAD0215336.1 Macrolide export ATP-binding/permease protein MacB [Rhizobium rhizogenes]